MKTMAGRNVKSSLELAVLGLLWQEPRSGYDLLRVFSETAMGSFSNSPGAIYPALKRLKVDGWITGEVTKRDTLRPREVFRLTTAGTDALKDALRRPVTHDDIVRREGDVLLQFAFAGEVLGREEAIRILEEYADRVEQYVPSLKSQLDSLPKEASPYGWYTLKHGHDMYKSGARWARKAISELKEAKS